MFTRVVRRVLSTSTTTTATATATPAVSVSSACKDRILHLQQVKEDPNSVLRVAVDAGGCSGYRYIFEMVDIKTDFDQTEDVVYDDILVVRICFFLFYTSSFFSFFSRLSHARSIKYRLSSLCIQ
jgi:hypothetical protein